MYWQFYGRGLGPLQKIQVIISCARLITRAHDLYLVRTTYNLCTRLISRAHDLYLVRTTYISCARLITCAHDLYLVRTTYISCARLISLALQVKLAMNAITLKWMDVCYIQGLCLLLDYDCVYISIICKGRY